MTKFREPLKGPQFLHVFAIFEFTCAFDMFLALAGSKLGYRWVTTVEVMLVFQASDCYGITWGVELFLG